jgi:hypothetical protein
VTPLGHHWKDPRRPVSPVDSGCAPAGGPGLKMDRPGAARNESVETSVNLTSPNAHWKPLRPRVTKYKKTKRYGGRA